MNVPELLTVKEVAVVLRMSQHAVECAISRGQIPGVVRIGRRVRVRAEDLKRWIDKACT